jgi:hypothetical protein
MLIGTSVRSIHNAQFTSHKPLRRGAAGRNFGPSLAAVPAFAAAAAFAARPAVASRALAGASAGPAGAVAAAAAAALGARLCSVPPGTGALPRRSPRDLAGSGAPLAGLSCTVSRVAAAPSAVPAAPWQQNAVAVTAARRRQW